MVQSTKSDNNCFQNGLIVSVIGLCQQKDIDKTTNTNVLLDSVLKHMHQSELTTELQQKNYWFRVRKSGKKTIFRMVVGQIAICSN